MIESPFDTVETIQMLLQRACARLATTSDTPRLDAEILLGHALCKARSHLHAWPENAPREDQCRQFRHLLERRAAGEPMAYIIGKREFWSRNFLTSPEVLIPRPETELLIETALELMGVRPTATIADLGTGSGAIAVTLALELQNARICAADISLAALKVAAHNAESLGASGIQWFRSDWLRDIPEGNFDLIVSNPPYIAENDPHLGHGDLRFEPRGALASGADGLDAIRAIATQASARLAPHGYLVFEHGYDQATAVRALLSRLRYREIRHHHDLQGHQRATSAMAPTH